MVPTSCAYPYPEAERRMRQAIIGCTAVSATLTAVVLTACAPKYTAAGVILYSRAQGVTYVLIADHVDSDRGWGTFGGHRERGENVPQAASRELYEETRCVYNIPDDVLTEMPSVERGSFLSYITEVPMVSTEAFDSNSVSSECKGGDFDERGPWVWIPLSEIVRSLEEGDATGNFQLRREFIPEGVTTKLWDESARILQLAIAKGYM
jgi:8-oxo-dGTP pyrophosphatase MutT (NUDIX family)